MLQVEQRVVVERAGQAEIGQVRLPGLVQEDVAWLEIAMDQAPRVGVGQRRGDLAGDVQGHRLVERPAMERLRQGSSGHVGHHVEGPLAIAGHF